MQAVPMCATLTFVLAAIAASTPLSVVPAGAGTGADPYLIDSLPNLRWLSMTRTVWSDTFAQTRDIDAAETRGWVSGKGDTGFFPIGSDYEFRFRGVYHGRGHTIRNLFLQSRNRTYQGLFGVIGETALVDSLELASIAYSGTVSAGGAVGRNVKGILRGVKVSGRIAIEVPVGEGKYIGGLLAENDSGGRIESCSAQVDVEGVSRSTLDEMNIGGLVGVNHGSITNSRSKGVLHVVADLALPVLRLGGLVGFNEGDLVGCEVDDSLSVAMTQNGKNIEAGGMAGVNLGRIQTCRARVRFDVRGISCEAGGLVGRNEGPIVSSEAEGELGVTGQSWMLAGGLVGTNTSEIRSCQSSGSLAAYSSSTVVAGGLVGANMGALTLCSAKGSVLAGGGVGEGSAGGLVGDNSSRIERCRATGTVSVVQLTKAWAGGLLGTNSGTVVNSHAGGDVRVVRCSNVKFAELGGENSGRIEESYASGRLELDKLSESVYQGGIVSYNDQTGAIRNGYWNRTGSSAAGPCKYDIGTTLATGLDSAQMRRSASFVGFDFAAVWIQDEGVGLPRLRGLEGSAAGMRPPTRRVAPAPPVRRMGRELRFEGWEGTIWIFDAQGRLLAHLRPDAQGNASWVPGSLRGVAWARSEGQMRAFWLSD